MHGARWKHADTTGAPVDAMILAGKHVYCAMEGGSLAVFSTEDGKHVATQDIEPIVWDGMAAANGCIYLSTKAGDIVCLSEAPASHP